MLTAKIFQPEDTDIEKLIRSHPFALVICGAADSFQATPLPLLVEYATSGEWVLIGHFARANPQVAQLQKDPRALIVFQGPHGYISPSWMRDRTQAPTWNLMMVQCHVEINFEPGLAHAIEAVDLLSAVMESGRPDAWSPDEMGERHSRLAQGVIAFRATVTEINAKFKLGQNERIDVLEDILKGLDHTGQRSLQAAMSHANRERRAASSNE